MALRKEGNRLVSDLPDLKYDHKYKLSLSDGIPGSGLVVVEGFFRSFRRKRIDQENVKACFLVYTNLKKGEFTFLSVRLSSVGEEVR